MLFVQLLITPFLDPLVDYLFTVLKGYRHYSHSYKIQNEVLDLGFI